MKIISFPHYTCGALLCSILNNEPLVFDKHKRVNSFSHSLGKIGDNSSVFAEFDYEALKTKLKKAPPGQWCGTHCWLGNVPIIDFEQVIAITTVTHKSKLYRWARAYHLYFSTHIQCTQLHGMALIDKQVNNAKKYLIPFKPIPGAINIEFSEIVDRGKKFINLISEYPDWERKLDTWAEINSFLYNDLDRSTADKRFHEAEYEVLLNEYYIYE
jgi:hypothetical protein